MRQLRARANGEVVSLLWNGGQSTAADRLEVLWNRLIAAACPAGVGFPARGEAAVLWIRANLPEYADEILARARHGVRHTLSSANSPS